MIFLSTSFKCPLLHVAHRGVFVPYLVADAVLWCKKCDDRQSQKHFYTCSSRESSGSHISWFSASQMWRNLPTDSDNWELSECPLVSAHQQKLSVYLIA